MPQDCRAHWDREHPVRVYLKAGRLQDACRMPALQVGALLRGRWLDRDVEMQDLLAHAELVVERDGRIVAMVGLDIDDPGAAAGGDPAQMPDQCGGDALPAMRLIHRQVIDVDLASRLFELVELIGDKPSHHRLAGQGDEHDHMVLGEQSLAIGLARRLALVGLRLAEGDTEQGVQLTKKRNVRGCEAMEREGWEGFF